MIQLFPLKNIADSPYKPKNKSQLFHIEDLILWPYNYSLCKEKNNIPTPKSS
jgi:hypothetical protein